MPACGKKRGRLCLLGLTNGCPSCLAVGIFVLVSFCGGEKGTAPVQVLGESNWILGLKVFVESVSPTGIFGLFVPST